MSVLPNDRTIPKDQDAEPASHRAEKRDREARHERQEARHERQREASKAQREAGKPMPASAEQLPPLIRRQEVVAIALVGLLLIAVITVLYFAKAFFLPVMMAFVVGTMLSPVASFLERYRVPRGVGAVLIVVAVAAIGTFIVGLIAAPAMEWGSRLPELVAKLKDKLHIFDRPLALWHELSDHARRLRRARDDADAEIRMGAADAGIPVADLHRIPAVLRDAAAVHRELEGPAPRHDHGFWRPAFAVAHAAYPQRDRGASRRLSADGDHDQCRTRDCDRDHLRTGRNAQSRRGLAHWLRR